MTCQGFHNDFTFSREKNDIRQISVTSRNGIIVIQAAENETATQNISVLTRFVSNDFNVLQNVISRFEHSIFDKSLKILACPVEGSDDSCLTSKMRGDAFTSFPMPKLSFLASVFGVFFLPAFADAESIGSCLESAITITIPHGWRGELLIQSESSDVAFNNPLNFPLNFTSLRVDTFSSIIASPWETVLSIDGKLDLNVRDIDGKVYLAQVEMTGFDGDEQCQFLSKGNAEITFSVVTMPDRRTKCLMDVNVEEHGYFGMPNLKKFDGKFESTVDNGGETSFSGIAIEMKMNSLNLKAGIVNGGNGLHDLKVFSAGGRSVIFCHPY
jgi:hypothetical protein